MRAWSVMHTAPSGWCLRIRMAPCGSNGLDGESHAQTALETQRRPLAGEGAPDPPRQGGSRPSVDEGPERVFRSGRVDGKEEQVSTDPKDVFQEWDVHLAYEAGFNRALEIVLKQPELLKVLRSQVTAAKKLASIRQRNVFAYRRELWRQRERAERARAHHLEEKRLQ